MNTVTAVRMMLVLLMLCSGLFHTAFAAQRLRLFGNVTGDEKNKKPWREAFRDCEGENKSFVTVYDEEDAEFLSKFTPVGVPPSIRYVWLGLRYVGDQSEHTWSNGDPVVFNQISEKLEKGEQKCEAIHDDKWQSFNCSDKKSFMCFKGNTYTLHSTNKTWCQALQHCRNTHSELVSITSKEQNEEVIKKGNGSSFWIGLRRDEWRWDDDGCSSFRKWNDKSPEDPCTIIGVNGNTQSALLYRYGYNSTAEPLCAAGGVRIKVIKVNKTWEEALDYCYEHHSRPLWIQDGDDQKAVTQWLSHSNVSGPFWTGLRQSRVFGFWIWSDSMVVYTNWKDGKEPEPSTYNLCGVIDKKDEYKWSERNCTDTLPFLCEEDIIYM